MSSGPHRITQNTIPSINFLQFGADKLQAIESLSSIFRDALPPKSPRVNTPTLPTVEISPQHQNSLIHPILVIQQMCLLLAMDTTHVYSVFSNNLALQNILLYPSSTIGLTQSLIQTLDNLLNIDI